MRKLYKRMLQISSAFGLILSTTNSYAIDCTPTPDCATLGYTKTASDCSGVAAIKCPFDTSKLFCEEKILTKTCDSVGDVLYGDGTCAISPDKLDSSRTPIGIVFDTSHRLAMALTDAKKDGSIYYTGSGGAMNWSSAKCDIVFLTNCTADLNLNALATCSVDGRANTKEILTTNGGCSGTTYAANAANLYNPKGCSKDFCKQGQWFLPSMRDLQNFYDTYNVVKNTFDTIKSRVLVYPLDKYAYYWSSVEQNAGYACYVILDSGFGYCYDKTKTVAGNVRPVVVY